MENQPKKNFLHWYLSFDTKDFWNYIFLGLAIGLMWWGVKTIVSVVAIK